jgi:hypothetical protein
MKTLTTILAAALVSNTLAMRVAQTNPDEQFRQAIRNTTAMVTDQTAQRLAARHNLQILDLTWEDTGRYKNSSVGPNISDMTIQVQQRDPVSGSYSVSCMPVIRFPNFSDRTGDIAPDKFFLLVGNEKGRGLARVTLREFLGNFRAFLHDADSWKGTNRSLLADRDSHVLVSAQACFLPIPKAGKAEFNPVLFNYQSYRGNPAVLAIVAGREGASATIIDNTRDGFAAGGAWGQRLFFNQNGERASLTGTRQSDFSVSTGDPDQRGGVVAKAGLNMVMLIQVPLKQRQPMRYKMADEAMAPMACAKSEAKRSDVENAVIGHGKVEGPFTEIDNLPIERDPAFPIRVTVQFYKATGNGVVSEADMAEIAAQIGKVYDEADYVGSLVTAGETNRPTEYVGDKVEPRDWWSEFRQRHFDNTGETPHARNGLLGW